MPSSLKVEILKMTKKPSWRFNRKKRSVVSQLQTWENRPWRVQRHPWAYSVPDCSHCSSLSEWSGTSIPYWTVHPYHIE